MRIGEVARLVGRSPSWIRLQERAGAIPQPPRSVTGFREYTHEHVREIYQRIFGNDSETVCQGSTMN